MAKSRKKRATRKRRSRGNGDASTQAPQASQNEAQDTMSKVASLCQEQRWREAAVLCRRVLDKAENDKNEDLVLSLDGAYRKIEYSLRRQQAAAVTEAAKDLLKKEYLLDVGE